ncbi:Clavesin-2 [Acipenser ruthenus]|uniref:Clavesin-2 n=1 Tax=Acipenser ruthenus TaxID=7906 RepID=A0A444UMW3_ACIRT|nr:Clavesin-2 [Acipenser ruthenus]
MTDVVTDFEATGRTGRRNALPDILGSPAGVGTSELPHKLAELSMSGVGLPIRKVGNVTKPTIIISQEGDKIVVKTQSTFKNTEISFELGVEFDENTPDGRNCKSTVHQDGDKLVHVQKWDGKETKFIREIKDGKMVMDIWQYYLNLTKANEEKKPDWKLEYIMTRYFNIKDMQPKSLYELALRYTFVDILRAILLSLEAMIEDPELQVNGFVLIIDWSNFTFKQASKLTPSMLRLAIEGLQIFMHGNNLNSLHQLIHPEILPSEFGGMLPPYDMGTWARTLLDHEYDDDSEHNPESYNLAVEELEQDLSPKTMKRSQSVVEPGVLKRPDKEKREEENMQPLLSLD